jgi:phosphate-selective porin OprO/OprP
VDVTVPGANSHQKYGLEAALVMGPFSLQGEYIRVDVDTSTGTDPAFSGYYAYASWFLTGESRPYGEGRFNRVKAEGAWEVAVRFSSLDLNDAGFAGGEQDDVTLGLNYYHSPNLRFMVNYVMASADPSSAGVEDEPDILQARAQVDFK